MKNIYKALANFQQEVPTIHKGTAGYGYSYADLTAIYKIINPLMKKHGLGFTQPIVNNQMKTIVFHIESGESIESIADIPMNVQREYAIDNYNFQKIEIMRKQGAWCLPAITIL